MLNLRVFAELAKIMGKPVLKLAKLKKKYDLTSFEV